MVYVFHGEDVSRHIDTRPWRGRPIMLTCSSRASGASSVLVYVCVSERVYVCARVCVSMCKSACMYVRVRVYEDGHFSEARWRPHMGPHGNHMGPRHPGTQAGPALTIVVTNYLLVVFCNS